MSNQYLHDVLIIGSGASGLRNGSRGLHFSLDHPMQEISEKSTNSILQLKRNKIKGISSKLN